MINFLRSNSFKMSLFYLIIFSISVLILSFFLYRSTISYMAKETDSVIQAEINGLAEQYKKQGITELAAIIKKRLDKHPTSLSIYLLTNKEFTPIVGNLNAWPSVKSSNTGWLEFPIISLDQSRQLVRAKKFDLIGSYHLIVGRNIDALEQTKQLIFDAIAWFFALTVSLGVIGGYIMSKRMLSKVSLITESCENIIGGNLTKRIPRDASMDEMDSLSKTMNTMLESNYQAMLDVKRVSDNIAHDLKTPLSRLRNSLEEALILKDIESVKNKINSSVSEADTLLSMFNTLLRIVSIESGHKNTPLASVNLNALLLDIFDLYQPIAEEKDIDFSYTLPPHNIVVQSNNDLLFQAVANIIDNAIKYTKTHGKVQILLEEIDNQYHVTIQDNGVGVNEHDLENMTTRFYRADRSRNQPGTGLGLSVVSAICNALSLSLIINPLSQGLQVKLKLPTHKE